MGLSTAEWLTLSDRRQAEPPQGENRGGVFWLFCPAGFLSHEQPMKVAGKNNLATKKLLADSSDEFSDVLLEDKVDR